MRLVIADTGPINYLILIGHIEILPLLFDQVLIPTEVRSELASRKAPSAVQNWVANRPDWLQIYDVSIDKGADISSSGVDKGERAAIELAISLQADLLLMDDRRGARAAQRKGLNVTGTLGVLDLAGRRGLINLLRPSIVFDKQRLESQNEFLIRC